MGLVSDKYRQACSVGFDGFLDDISIQSECETAGGGILFVRGWGRVCTSSLKRILVFEVPSDQVIGAVDVFFGRSDLPERGLAFEARLPLGEGLSGFFYDYAFLAESEDGKLFPIFLHSSKNVQIELDGRCNLACVMCPQVFGVHSGPLGRDDLQKLLPVIRESECIEINHQGESLLSPLLEELLSLVPPHKHIALNCNGTALKGKVARVLLEHAPPVRTISISIDAGTEENFFKIRGASLEKIMDNAVAFKAARDAAGLHFPRLMVTCTVIAEFMEDVPPIVALAAKLDGVFRYWPLVASGLHGGSDWVTPFKGSDELFVYDQQIPRDARKWNSMAEAVRIEAERLAVNIVDPFQYSWGAQDGEEILQPRKGEGVSACPLIHRQQFFNANGNAQMCCVQTRPIFNWREFGASNFDRHPDVIKARHEAQGGLIPRYCSGAACSYVAGELSVQDESKPLTYIERGFI